ncbi:unnamed protein product [Closterium sp. NIES-64]|nr:unnamed protein product [Closterium sp. Naga37s-1]CAI6000700.1 unnamed protein product [Closterium sp. NIES-64]
MASAVAVTPAISGLATSRAAATVSRDSAHVRQHATAALSHPLRARGIRGLRSDSFRGKLARAGTSSQSAFSVQCNLVRKVNGKELDALLSGDRPLPMVIDFYATWCGPCILLAQELEQLAVEYHGEVLFLKVDTDEEYELANQLEIRGLPTVVFVSKDKSKLAVRTEGLLPIASIKQLIEEM